MLPIKITNRCAKRYQLAKHNVIDTNKVYGLVVHLPLKRGNLPPGVNLPQLRNADLYSAIF